MWHMVGLMWGAAHETALTQGRATIAYLPSAFFLERRPYSFRQEDKCCFLGRLLGTKLLLNSPPRPRIRGSRKYKGRARGNTIWHQYFFQSYQNETENNVLITLEELLIPKWLFFYHFAILTENIEDCQEAHFVRNERCEVKFWTRLFTFHLMLMSFGKAWTCLPLVMGKELADWSLESF